MIVNGVSNIIAFLPNVTADGNTPGTSILTVPLKSGSANVIKFEAYNGGYGMHSLSLLNKCFANAIKWLISID